MGVHGTTVEPGSPGMAGSCRTVWCVAAEWWGDRPCGVSGVHSSPAANRGSRGVLTDNGKLLDDCGPFESVEAAQAASDVET